MKNGNAKQGRGCPHDCARCRAIEAGRGGPYTPADFLELGLVVFPSSERPEPSVELAEARLRIEVAQAAYDEGMRDCATIVRAIQRGSNQRVGLTPWGETVVLADGEDLPGSQELNEGLEAALARRADVGEQLRAARQAERVIAVRESDERQRVSVAESAAAFEERRAARTKGGRGGLRVLERLRGPSGNGKGQ